jgi:Helix-turn-helix domain
VADAVPDFFTIPEAARVLRVGRTAAYLLAKRHLVAGGREGLPVVWVGRLLRVPRAELERLVGGPITWPLPAREDPTVTPVAHASTTTPAPSRRMVRRQDAAQLTLLESD